MLLALIINIIAVFYFGGSSFVILGIIYQVQILMLLPLIGIDFGEDVIDFYRFIDQILFTFKFIPDFVVFFGFQIFDDYHYPQNDWYLYLINMTSRSSLVNTTELLWVVSILAVLIFVIA
jgi:hypothetical protein